MITSKILVPRRNGGQLNADYFTPDSSDSELNDTLLILCHGFTGERTEWGRLTHAGEKLAENNYHAIIFDFSGSGENVREPITLSKQVQDLEDVVQWGREQGFSRFATIGLSFGGLTSSLANIPDRFTAIFWAPAFYMNRILRKKTGPLYGLIRWKLCKPGSILHIPKGKSKQPTLIIDHNFYEEIDKVNLDSFLPNFTIPSLIIQGTSDKSALYPWTKEAFSKFPQDDQHQMIDVPGATHDFNGEHLEQFISISIDWLKKFKP
jgi:pimeloyl-ACP methyl ester carboxylesterase